MFIGVRGVREGAGEQSGVAKPIAEARLQARAPLGCGVVFLDRAYSRYLRKASVAFVPPNPKAFEMAISMSCLRAWFGT